MQVLTLHPKAFDTHAFMLAEMVESDHKEAFDALVAVRRGGSYVCDAFCRHFPKKKYSGRFDVTLQRPSTKKKNGIVSHILKCLPYPVLNAMRIIEARMLEMRHRNAQETMSRESQVSLPEDLDRMLRSIERPEILLIDDAIDSGHTLFEIEKTLKETNPNVGISVAVFTETTPNPCIRADYSLYSNRTLIRFPWSNDYKTKNSLKTKT